MRVTSAPADTIAGLIGAVRSFSGQTEQIDDITVTVTRRAP